MAVLTYCRGGGEDLESDGGRGAAVIGHAFLGESGGMPPPHGHYHAKQVHRTKKERLVDRLESPQRLCITC